MTPRTRALVVAIAIGGAAATAAAQIVTVPPPTRVYLWLKGEDAAARQVVAAATAQLRRLPWLPVAERRDESDVVLSLVSVPREDGGTVIAVAFLANTKPLPTYLDIMVMNVGPTVATEHGRDLAETTAEVVREFHDLIRKRR